jgi:LmbE family N-acetylglucosaminyl deacetylase
MSMRVLVVAAHPDDEILGCGGTIARHAEAGDDVDILILAEGITSRDDARDQVARHHDLEKLHETARRAAVILGAREPRLRRLPDNRLDQVPLIEVAKIIEAIIAERRPEIVYTHHGGDLNIDHRVVHQSVLAACRPLPGASVRSVFTFETVSSTEWGSDALGEAFRPHRFVDITRQLHRKRAALDCYRSEMRAFPHARSVEAIESLARWRGSSAGLDAAEAFMVVREVVR